MYFALGGERIENQLAASLTIAAAQKTRAAIDRHANFGLVEQRHLLDAKGHSEILVVDCTNDSVPTKNKVGILYRERLALVFFSDPDIQPEVFSIRQDFPVTLHQNDIPPGGPASLCIYFEPWTSVIRTWTPQKHLRRILWWLEKTADGTLHRTDQPLEQLYFNSKWWLTLPHNFEERANDPDYVLSVEPRKSRDNLRGIIASFVSVAEFNGVENQILSCLALQLDAVVHGLERTPTSLGALDEQMRQRGISFAAILFDKIKIIAEKNGINKTKEEYTLLVFNIPIMRKEGGQPKKNILRGFIIHSGIGNLGIQAGILSEHKNKYWQTPIIGNPPLLEGWRELGIEPIEIVHPFTRKLARLSSGIGAVGPTGILSGVGALGSAIHNNWQRSGWGEWSLVDPDHIKPHNLARHNTYSMDIGSYKVDAVASLTRQLYPHHAPQKCIPKGANNFAETSELFEGSELIVDTTTTLDVPRDLAINNESPRVCSAFLTPSGQGSALLIEDTERIYRIDMLEAQYYRAIISRNWGKDHLEGHSGHFWAGAGCRDVSRVISNDNISLHASILANQIRLKSETDQAAIQVWNSDHHTGTVTTSSISPSRPIIQNAGDFRLVWDKVLRDKIRRWRRKKLPKETGGVLLGYLDLKQNSIYIVDAIPAPPDSEEDSGSFARGVIGLEKRVNTANKQTAEIVTYVGEWHSHPPGVSTKPSTLDTYLLAHLAIQMAEEGSPALMLIVGDSEENWFLGELRN